VPSLLASAVAVSYCEMRCPTVLHAVMTDRRGAAEVRKQVSSTYFGDTSKSTASNITTSFTSRQNVGIVCLLLLL